MVTLKGPVSRFTALDGLRGLCALLVALYHFNYYGHLYALTFIRNSYLFVDFFFVLSGFVIASAYCGRLENRVDAEQFMLRRFGRLWPLHAAILLAFIGNELLKLTLSHWLHWDKPPFSGNTSIFAIFTNLLLMQGVGLHDRLTWNFPSWSISAEFYTYLVFAAITLVFQRSAVIVFAFLVLASCGILVSHAQHYMDATYDLGIFRSFYGFSLGVLCFQLYRRTYGLWEMHPLAQTIAEILAIEATILFICGFGYGFSSFFAPLVFFAMVYVFAFERGLCAAALHSKPLQALGALSYSIYMVHVFLLTCMDEAIHMAAKLLHKTVTKIMINGAFDEYGVYVIGSPWVADVLALIYLPLVLFTAAFTYRFIEMPGKIWFYRVADRLRDGRSLTKIP